jgi:threonine dehydrogenase-like Zn-dependent dehydrogenase
LFIWLKIVQGKEENNLKTIRVKNLQSNAKIALTEIDRPIIIHPNEVIIQVLCVGLDGTDQEILFEHYGTPPKGETDLTTGHESLGVNRS